jgi:hypothetical protein
MTTRRQTRFGRFSAPLLLACALFSLAPPTVAQSWQSEDWVPLFRPTEVQTLALEKMRYSATCRINLLQLSTAARDFAFNHDDRLPSQFQEFTNALSSPGILYCPADSAHPRTTEWSRVDFAAISYEIVAPSILVSGPETVYLRCRVHGNSASSEGEVTEARPYDSRIPSASGIPIPALTAAKEAGVSLDCQLQLRDISLAARRFAVQHSDQGPSTLRELELFDLKPATLRCPSAVLTPAPTNFSDAALATSDYVLDAPGADMGNPDLHVAHCRLHGHIAIASGVTILGAGLYPPRLITGHPLSRTVAPGHNTALQILSGESNALCFQWRKLEPFDATGAPYTNTTVIAGATNSVLVITNAQPQDEGFYDVVVTDMTGRYQISHMAFVRVDRLATAFFDPATLCINNLKQIHLAGRLYASSHNDAPAPGLQALPPFLGWPIMLYCPADPQRRAPDDWSSLNFADTSYTFFSVDPYIDPTNIVVSCRVHNFAIRADNTVVSDPPRFTTSAVQVNGAIVLTQFTIPERTTILESSPDFVTWSPIATNTGAASIRWTNETSANHIFFRTTTR